MAAQLTARNGLGLACAVVIDGPGHQFFAGAAFAANQHGDVLRGDPADGFVNFLHRRAASDQDVVRGVGRGLGNAHGHVHDAADFTRPAHDLADLGDVQRLDQIIVGAQLHGFDGGVAGAAGGDENHRQLGIDGGDPLEQLEPGVIGEHDVQDHHVGPSLGNQTHPLLRATGRKHVHGGIAEKFFEQVQHRSVIVDDQQRGRTRGRGSRSAARLDRALNPRIFIFRAARRSHRLLDPGFGRPVSGRDRAALEQFSGGHFFVSSKRKGFGGLGTTKNPLVRTRARGGSPSRISEPARPRAIIYHRGDFAGCQTSTSNAERSRIRFEPAPICVGQFRVHEQSGVGGAFFAASSRLAPDL